MLAAAWLPNGHGDYWRKYGDNATELATLYENAKLYWAVPAYVPEGKVESVQDLIKDDVKDRMKKEIQGVGEDSGLMKRSQTMVAEYGLSQAGYEPVPGSASQWVQNFKQAVENDEWIIMPLWRPQWLNKAYDLRVLKDPEGDYGRA